MRSRRRWYEFDPTAEVQLLVLNSLQTPIPWHLEPLKACTRSLPTARSRRPVVHQTGLFLYNTVANVHGEKDADYRSRQTPLRLTETCNRQLNVTFLPSISTEAPERGAVKMGSEGHASANPWSIHRRALMGKTGEVVEQII